MSTKRSLNSIRKAKRYYTKSSWPIEHAYYQGNSKCKVHWEETEQDVSSLDGCTWNKLYHDNEERLSQEEMQDFYTKFMKGTHKKITVEDPAEYAKMLDEAENQSNDAKAIINPDF